MSFIALNYTAADDVTSTAGGVTAASPRLNPAHRVVNEEAELFLFFCVFAILTAFLWINYYVCISAHITRKRIDEYETWYNDLKPLEKESAKWNRIYWEFEQNNMMLQRLDSPRYWPIRPVVHPGRHTFELELKTVDKKKPVIHKPPEFIHHFINPKHESTITRLLTDPGYAHSVEVYTRHKDEGAVQNKGMQDHTSHSTKMIGTDQKSSKRQPKIKRGDDDKLAKQKMAIKQRSRISKSSKKM